MHQYRADLHIHSVLSPCGDLDMSPVNIVKQAVSAGLDMIAVTDHNHTGHCRVTREIGQEYDLWVVFGAEVNTGEDVHCLVYFDDEEQLACFQEYIDE
ncbi:MAG TPA: PHP domain-containing protein, partial [Bacteroidales bacterium]|nr:PHP domain-containing protein [Bacteroidales bacterium]